MVAHSPGALPYINEGAPGPWHLGTGEVEPTPHEQIPLAGALSRPHEGAPGPWHLGTGDRTPPSLRPAKHGSTATLNGGFAGDLEKIIDSHPESLENRCGYSRFKRGDSLPPHHRNERLAVHVINDAKLHFHRLALHHIRLVLPPADRIADGVPDVAQRTSPH